MEIAIEKRRKTMFALKCVEERVSQERANRLAASLLQELTPEEETAVNRVLDAPGSDSEVIVCHGQNTVTRGSIRTLRPKTWLGDEVIH